MKKSDKRRRAELQGTNEEEALKEALPIDLQEVSLLGLMRHGSQALLKQAMAEEIAAYLGRGYYRHLKEGQACRGFRNGTRRTTIDTPLGPVVYDRPRLAEAPEFQSRFHVPYMRRPEAFADAVADMHVNGVSTRNVKKALKAVAGEKIRMSKSTVSRITQRLREEFRVWSRRDLSGLKVSYLFLDAIRMKMRMGQKGSDAVMIAYAVLEDGSFETLSIGLKNSESDLAWKGFVEDLKARGLADPLGWEPRGGHGDWGELSDVLETAVRQAQDRQYFGICCQGRR